MFSYSGVYESYLNIKTNDREKLFEGIKAVIESNECVIDSYAESLGRGKMAILFQEYISDMSYSGVAFSHNPVSGDKEVIIEYSDRDSAVVSGKGEIYQFRQLSENSQNIMKMFQVDSIVNLVNQLFIESNGPVDVEWGIKDDQLYLFQCRKAIIVSEQFVPYKNKISVSNYVKCPVLAKGVSFFRYSQDRMELFTLDENYIYLFENLNNVVAVCNVKGNYLSHQMNILRENHIPVLNYNVDLFKDNNFYLFDGFNGCVIDWSSLDSDSKFEIFDSYFNFLKDNYNLIKRYGIESALKDIYTKIIYISNLDNIYNKLVELDDSSIKILNETIYDIDIFSNEIAFENGFDCCRLVEKQDFTQLQFKKILVNDDHTRSEYRYCINFNSILSAKRFINNMGLFYTRKWTRQVIDVLFKNIHLRFNKANDAFIYLSIVNPSTDDLEVLSSILSLPSPQFLSHEDIKNKIYE